MPRALVVGAGVSGLTAARRLRLLGWDVVVLESRDRIGGRTHTIDLAGHPLDLGASWIHGPVGNPLMAYLDQAGLTHHQDGSRQDTGERPVGNRQAVTLAKPTTPAL